MKSVLNTIFNASAIDDIIFIGVATLWIFAIAGAVWLLMPFVEWIAQKLDSHD
jgi:hypothetical protein